MARKKGEGSAQARRVGALLHKRREQFGLPREHVARDAKLATSTVARIELGYEHHPRAVVVGAILRVLRAAAPPSPGGTHEFEVAVLRALAGL